jgi:hypothetical protein
MPYEVIFQNDAAKEMQTTKTLMHNGCKVEVVKLEDGQSQICRIISTSLKDYLDPKLQPGTIIEA